MFYFKSSNVNNMTTYLLKLVNKQPRYGKNCLKQRGKQTKKYKYFLHFTNNGLTVTFYVISPIFFDWLFHLTMFGNVFKITNITVMFCVNFILVENNIYLCNNCCDCMLFL